ncbi:MAG TPA: hypothetical protein VMU88_09475 [bacterium]|nr:hypothetical protein [bacterium]
MASAKKPEGFLGWLGEILKLGLKPLAEALVQKLEERWEAWERRMLGLLVAYLSLFAGLFFLSLGVFFLLVDYAGIPRGVVFAGGGCVILLVSFVYLKASGPKA